MAKKISDDLIYTNKQNEVITWSLDEFTTDLTDYIINCSSGLPNKYHGMSDTKKYNVIYNFFDEAINYLYKDEVNDFKPINAYLNEYEKIIIESIIEKIDNDYPEFDEFDYIEYDD